MEQYILNTGSKLVLSLSISGGSTISYQWYHNDIKITGETNPTYTVNNVQIVNGGEYYCKIQDQIYSITSIKFLVLVIQKLEIKEEKTNIFASFCLITSLKNPDHSNGYGL